MSDTGQIALFYVIIIMNEKMIFTFNINRKQNKRKTFWKGDNYGLPENNK